jgi:hypothetical protein
MLRTEELAQNEEQFYNAPPIQQPKEKENYGLANFVSDAVEATFPGQLAIKYPVLDKTVDENFQEKFYTNVYPNLTETERATIDNVGGAWNEQQAYAILDRVKRDNELQQDMYAYGGFAGSVGIQVGVSLFNPVDLGIAVATLGTGKAFTSLKQIQSITNRYRKTSAIGLGAIEGATAGYLSETIRQETSGLQDDDARFDTFLFGSVLGGTIGASGWFKMLNGMHPSQQSRIAAALDADREEFAASVEDVVQSSNKSVGSAGYVGTDRNIDIEDVSDAPTIANTSVFSRYFSPRAWLYSRGSKATYNIMSKLAPSNDALKYNGEYVTQSNNTAWDIKREYEGKKGTLVSKLTKSYNDINLDRQNKGLPKFSEEEFMTEAFKLRTEATLQVRNRQAEIDYLSSLKERTPEQDLDLETLKATPIEKQYRNDMERQMDESLDEYYKFMEDELRRPKIEKELNQLRNQLDELPQGDVNDATRTKLEAKLRELEAWEPTEYKGYLTRIFDKDKIQADSSVVRRLTVALQKSPTARAISKYGTPEEVRKFMDEQVAIAKNMSSKIERAKDLNELRDLVGGEGAGGSGIVSGGFAAGRRIDVDERLLDDLVQNNYGEVLDFYHTDMSGKLAIRKAFKDDELNTWSDFKDKYLNDLSEEFRVAGTDAGEKSRTLQSLQTVFEDLRGTKGIMDNPNSWGQNLKKILTTFNNIKFGPNFPLVTLNELGPTIHQGSVKSLRYFAPAVKEAINKIRNKEVATEFVNELQGIGIGADIQHSKAMMRYTEGSHFFESNKIVNGLRKAEHAIFRYGGLIGMTDAMKTMLVGGFTARITNISKRLASGGKLSTTEKAMLSRVGLTSDDLQLIAKQPIIYDERGLLKSFNFEAWEEGVADMYARTLNRVTKGNILEPTEMDLPNIMTDPNKPLNGILFQYYKFPFAAQSSLLSKAINDNDVGALGAAMVSGVTTALVEYAKVMGVAKLAELAGLDYDNPYDDIVNDTDQQALMAGKLFQTNPFFGVIPTAVNLGAFVGGYDIPGTSYTPKDPYSNLANASIGNIIDLGKSLGDADETTNWISKQVPRVPFLYDLQKSFIEEEF